MWCETDCEGSQVILGPSVSEADSSLIRRYYTKQYTPTRAHTRTQEHTGRIWYTNASHKARGGESH